MGTLLTAAARILPVEKWLGQHHRVEKGADGEEIHVFDMEHGNVFGSGVSIKHYEITVHLASR